MKCSKIEDTIQHKLIIKVLIDILKHKSNIQLNFRCMINRDMNIVRSMLTRVVMQDQSNWEYSERIDSEMNIHFQ